MTTARKKAGPPGGVGSAGHKAAQDAMNQRAAFALHEAGVDVGRQRFEVDRMMLKAPDGSVLVEVKRPRGRPATGRTPDKIRKAKQRALLTQAGGRQLSIELLPEHAAALDAIRARKGYTSDREAVYDWLARSAKRAKA